MLTELLHTFAGSKTYLYRPMLFITICAAAKAAEWRINMIYDSPIWKFLEILMSAITIGFFYGLINVKNTNKKQIKVNLLIKLYVLIISSLFYFRLGRLALGVGGAMGIVIKLAYDHIDEKRSTVE